MAGSPCGTGYASARRWVQSTIPGSEASGVMPDARAVAQAVTALLPDHGPGVACEYLPFYRNEHPMMSLRVSQGAYGPAGGLL